MKLLNLTLPTPAENLAADEALLDFCEDGGGAGGILRFWEPQEYFVVLGYANHVAKEVNQAACDAKGIPILRRCSGGGTVLQGPGCLNYSLVIGIGQNTALQSITSTNRFIMERNRKAVETLLVNTKAETQNSNVEIQGHTDLVIHKKKFSGNAQRRKKHFLLFHGTFLLHFDLALVETVLPMPSRQPDYRQDRGHQDFLTNLETSSAELARNLAAEWNALESFADVPKVAIGSLARHRYVTREWNLKF